MAFFNLFLLATSLVTLSLVSSISASGAKSLSAGESCHPNSIPKCGSGLSCEDEVCKIEDRGECTDTPDLCVSGKACVGTLTKKKCKTLMGPGEQCEVDPFWVCENGLECDDKVCKITQGGECTESPTECLDGLTCVGTNKRKLCKVVRELGETCGQDPFWVCEDGLVCEGTCRIPEGGSCDDAPNACVSGTRCISDIVGSGKVCGKPKPAKPVPAGGACKVTGTDKCDKGLKCERNVCKIKSEGVCTNNVDDCQSGTMCVGTDRKKKCKRPMGVGKSCKDPFWVCRSSLVCDEHDLICKIPRGSACKKRTAKLCVSGTKCVGGRRKKCH